MPDQMAEDARGIRELFIVSGCSPRESQLKVVELYSPQSGARVAGEVDGAGGPQSRGWFGV